MMTTFLPFNQVSIFCQPTPQMGVPIGAGLASSGLTTEAAQTILTESGQTIIPE